MKVVVCNLGCKVNQYESDGIYSKLVELGFDVSENLEFADVYVLNTCAVTNEAEKKSRQAVARCLHFNKNAKVIVCGCASQNNSRQFEKKDGVVYISGVSGKSVIPQLIASLSLDNTVEKSVEINDKAICIYDLPKSYEEDLQPNVVRTRAYVKIQDGCNNFCSYCLIPYLRGRSRSRDIASIVAECERLQNNTNEIVLAGIDMSSFGFDIGTSLIELLENLKHINCRIRFGSLEANIISEQFLKATLGLKRFCPHFHLSLQSGDDQTLRAMNRKYTTEYYFQRVQLIRSYYPQAGITTDLICGFPTETQIQFENTLKFIDKVKFSDMHIFAYSKREGTVASKYPMIDGGIVKERTKQAEQIAIKNKEDYYKSFIGQEVEVLVETGGGYTGEYAKVLCEGKEGELKKVVIKGYDNKVQALIGE